MLPGVTSGTLYWSALAFSLGMTVAGNDLAHGDRLVSTSARSPDRIASPTRPSVRCRLKEWIDVGAPAPLMTTVRP
jgi:hypothetical protein